LSWWWNIQALGDPAVKGIVFTGNGKFFMAGADIPNLMKITSANRIAHTPSYPA